MRAVDQIKDRFVPPSTTPPQGATGVGTHPSLGATLLPLPVAVRLDVDLSTGATGSVPASKLIWISSRTEDRRVRTLGSVLIPN